MAKAPKASSLAPTNVPEAASSTPAPAADGSTAAPKAFKVGGLTLAVRKTVEIPPEALRPAPSSRVLPFKEWFSALKPGEEVFLPATFWAERGASAKPEMVRNKLNSAFKAWREEEGHTEARQNHQLLLVTRVKDIGGWTDEDGVQLFMRLRPASA